jgi:glyoxylase-like metal-dependent hydrolase (beta-lactamase superfamily II)
MDSPQYKIVHEQLDAQGTELTNIYFRYGGNFFVFSSQQDGIRKHTLIDTGDIRHSNDLSAILAASRIDTKNIERIIITHSHPDHYGLAHLLVKGSEAKILVHSNFKSIIDGDRTNFERGWLGLHNPTELQECNVEFLSPKNAKSSIDIGGLKFPRLVEPIPIGNAGKLEILAIPESADSHTHDQVIVLYSARDFSRPGDPVPPGYRPADDLLFPGDLWLMSGPLFDRKMKGFPFYFRRSYFRIRRLLAGKGWRSIMVIEQDLAVKEALKRYFSLIRVKPGHGEEFLGARILPLGLPADRDLFNELGYPENFQAEPGQPDLKLANLLEQAYAAFVREVFFWREAGYSFDEIAEFLVRIYREQIGGSRLVAVDRKQRRERMQATLSRLQNDTAVSPEMRQLAELTLPKLKRV